jgi:hypothetical protein
MAKKRVPSVYSSGFLQHQSVPKWPNCRDAVKRETPRPGFSISGMLNRYCGGFLSPLESRANFCDISHGLRAFEQL